MDAKRFDIRVRIDRDGRLTARRADILLDRLKRSRPALGDALQALFHLVGLALIPAILYLAYKRRITLLETLTAVLGALGLQLTVQKRAA
mgnify:CR=1 FL=1